MPSSYSKLLLKRRAVCSALAGTPADLVTVTMQPRAARLNSHVRTRNRLPFLLGGGFGMRGRQSSWTDGSAYHQDHIPTPHLSASICLSVLEMMSAGLPGKHVRELFRPWSRSGRRLPRRYKVGQLPHGNHAGRPRRTAVDFGSLPKVCRNLDTAGHDRGRVRYRQRLAEISGR
jgi:hypothetical protein